MPLVPRLPAPLLVVLLLLAAPLRAEIAVEDSRGRHVFEDPPRRVAALSWAMVEPLLELGAPPAAVADPQGYATWVRRPEMPEGVADLGKRQEPNLERLAEIDPDLILISDDQLPMAERLSRIAPVLHFEAFGADQDNAAKAREILTTLARLLGREAQAEARLAEMEARLETLRAEIAARFGGDPPAATVIRFSYEGRVILHGPNSMPAAALEALGLEPGIEVPPADWGIAIKPLSALGAAGDSAVLALRPNDHAQEVMESPLWKAMPFVQADRFAEIPATWTYGGALSVGYLAEAVAEGLLPLAE